MLLPHEILASLYKCGRMDMLVGRGSVACLRRALWDMHGRKLVIQGTGRILGGPEIHRMVRQPPAAVRTLPGHAGFASRPDLCMIEVCMCDSIRIAMIYPKRSPFGYMVMARKQPDTRLTYTHQPYCCNGLLTACTEDARNSKSSCCRMP